MQPGIRWVRCCHACMCACVSIQQHSFNVTWTHLVSTCIVEVEVIGLLLCSNSTCHFTVNIPHIFSCATIPGLMWLCSFSPPKSSVRCQVKPQPVFSSLQSLVSSQVTLQKPLMAHSMKNNIFQKDKCCFLQRPETADSCKRYPNRRRLFVQDYFHRRIIDFAAVGGCMWRQDKNNILLPKEDVEQLDLFVFTVERNKQQQPLDTWWIMKISSAH